MIIGVTGDKRAGKDSVARVLVNEFGYQRYALADPLREALLALDPMIVSDPYPWMEMLRLSEALSEYGGWEGIKDSPYAAEVRRLQERQGTEAGRDIYGKNHWLEVLYDRVANGCYDNLIAQDIVIPDVRFDNEAEWVRSHSGIIIRVQRNGTTKTGHASAEGIATHYVDYSIGNNDTLDELAKVVREILWDLAPEAA